VVVHRSITILRIIFPDNLETSDRRHGETAGAIGGRRVADAAYCELEGFEVGELNPTLLWRMDAGG
jgi:hypothetical protein